MRATYAPIFRRVLGMWLGILCLSVAGVAGAERVSGSQRAAAEQFLAAVASGEPQALAYAIHPADLDELRRRLLAMMREEAKRNDSTIRSRLFGRGMPLSEIERLTSIGFFSTLAQKLHITGREYRDVDPIAAIPDKGGTVLVLVRGRQPRDRGNTRVVNVVALKPYGKDWKAAIPSELEAQIEDLIEGRGSAKVAVAQQAAGMPRAPGSAGGSNGEVPPGILELIDNATRALAASQCEQYYDEYVSPNFRRVTSKKALEALVGNCQNSLATREMLLSTLRIIRTLEPRLQYQGRRAVYDLSGQGLPFDRFVLEEVSGRWFVAE